MKNKSEITNNVMIQLCELLAEHRSARTEQKKLRVSYLSTKGKEATKLLRERSDISEQVHRISSQISSLSLNLIG